MLMLVHKQIISVHTLDQSESFCFPSVPLRIHVQGPLGHSFPMLLEILGLPEEKGVGTTLALITRRRCPSVRGHP
jgi:hypothetical protein